MKNQAVGESHIGVGITDRNANLLSRHEFFCMKWCPALLLLCILAMAPVHAAVVVNNCSGTAMAGEGAEVRINTVPDTIWVTIDGNKLGATPYQENIGLKGFTYGAHKLVLGAPGYDEVTTYFGLCYGMLTDIRVDMNKTVPVTTLTTAVPTKTPPVSGSRSVVSIGNEPEPGPVRGADHTGPATNPEIPTGSLAITTTPPGIEVFLDGSLRGISPLTIDNLAPGTHSLLLKREGYDDSTVQVMITAGQVQQYNAAMVPVTTTPAAPGFGILLPIAALGGSSSSGNNNFFAGIFPCGPTAQSRRFQRGGK